MLTSRALSPGRVTWALVSPNQKPVLVDQNKTLFRMDSAELDLRLKNSSLIASILKNVNIGSVLALKIEAETKELDLIKELAKKSDGVASYQIERLLIGGKSSSGTNQDNAHFAARYKIELKDYMLCWMTEVLKARLTEKLSFFFQWFNRFCQRFACPGAFT